jgi:hypothetical protein
MIRSSGGSGGADEQDEESKMQDFMFKLNIVLFVGTIVAIKAGRFF